MPRKWATAMPAERHLTGRAQFANRPSTGAHSAGQSRVRSFIAVAFVIAALGLGGGGSSAPRSELLLQLIAALAAAAWLVVPREPGTNRQAHQRLWIMAGVLLALPCLQLLPLPPLIWERLPGREQELAALELVGAGAAWMPWSITPARTFASLLAILPALLTMGMVAGLDREGRAWVIAAIAGMAAVSLLLGALQLSAGMAAGWRPYGIGNLGFLNGFQANRNAQADVLLIGLVASASSLRTWSDRRQTAVDLILAALAALLLLGCVLTGSRAGMAMIPVALAAAAIIWLPQRIRGRAALLGLGAVLAAGAAGFLVLRQTAAVGRSLERFASEQDFRWELWQDTQYAIIQYWPFGSGIGSFKSVITAAERLEVVDPTSPVRAHNDYLELTLEGGVFGLMVLSFAAVWIGWMAIDAWRRRNPATRPQIVFAFAVMTIIALHSLVDYPLRSMALACLAGVAAGLLSAPSASRKARELTGT